MRLRGESALERVEAQFSPARAHETILLVEDNATVRGAAKNILAEAGYCVLEAGNGAEAIASARQHDRQIDLLLADIRMPGISGRDVAECLRTKDPQISVLYMSGYEGPNLGDDCFVLFRKPFTGAALLEKVRETLDSAANKISQKRKTKKREEP